MTNDKAYRFQSFRLDSRNWRLRKNNELRPLRPKTFAVLRYLLDNAGCLVTKEDLFAAIWPDTKVAESALPVCMNELRQALEDDSHRPRFVETVHRHGYRFIAPVALAQDEDEELPQLAAAQRVTVGRETEAARLLDLWERALRGTRQLVFLAGEPGVGKTTVVDKLLAAPRIAGLALVGRGQCIGRSGRSNAYFPVLEALGQICSGALGKGAGESIIREAPGWAAHLPQLHSGGPSRATGTRRITAAQMLTEMSAALTAIAAVRPIMIVLEDLHLSDRATIELVAYIAKRREPVRLMIVGTYRDTAPARDPIQLAPIVRDLMAHRQCHCVRLRGLKEAEVADYLHSRIDGSIATKLASQLHRRTDGNPLFMTAIIDHLEALGSARSWPDDLRETGVPDNLHAMIEQQIEELPDGDQQILKLASVAAATSLEFSSAALCAALDSDAGQDEIEEQCEQLARRSGFLRATGVAQWPDGTVAASYTFGHALHHEVLYAMMSAGQRARVHNRIALRLETGYGTQAAKVASELAIHFERGGDARRAARHLNIAADNAIRRGAGREALVQVEKALKLLRTLPRDDDRLGEEFRLLVARMTALSTGRHATARIEATMAQIRELAHELGTWAAVLLVVQGMTKLVVSPMESRAAEYLMKAGLRQAESRSAGTLSQKFAPIQSSAHAALSIALNLQGKFARAKFHAERALETYDPRYQFAGYDTRVFATAECAMAQWFMGSPERARKLAFEAIAIAEKTANAPALAFALARAATLCGYARDWKESLALTERLIAFAADKDVQPWGSWGAFLRGAARARLGEMREGLRQMRLALADLESKDGAQPATFTTHARAQLRCEEVEAGLLRPHEAAKYVQESIDECEETGIVGLQGDLYRMMGWLKAAEPEQDRHSQVAAEMLFRKSVAIAHRQGAKFLELRAALELARLWQRQDKSNQARKMLSAIHRRFAEGHRTPDLQEANQLIAQINWNSAPRR
jgi:DNA-binding winged helix-turn-helix (wHTH) protein/tetratricopeptide (TPR) repeat protein